MSVQSNELPDHQWWRLFCSPHIKPCCWAKNGFLNPGRRQCVGGGRSLHQVTLAQASPFTLLPVHTLLPHSKVMIGYLEEFWMGYAEAPRRWAAVNTMVAHEHFMLRLPSLDADLASLLLRLASSALQDTVGIPKTSVQISGSSHPLASPCPINRPSRLLSFVDVPPSMCSCITGLPNAPPLTTCRCSSCSLITAHTASGTPSTRSEPQSISFPFCTSWYPTGSCVHAPLGWLP